MTKVTSVRRRLINMLTSLQYDLNEKGIEAAPAVQFDNGGFDVGVDSPTTDSDGNTSVSIRNGWGAASLRNTLSLSAVPSEIENGMTVKGIDGYDGYISAVLVRENAAPHLYFVKISGDAYGAVKIPCDYSQTIPDDSLPKFSNGNSFFPASIAAGDFDNDGYRNEVALTWSDIDHVYVRVVQLSYDTGSKQYSLKEIYSSTVHDYEYSSLGIERDRGKDMDGAGTMYSASVAAGNFDGKPGDEFAVVFRDNKPDNADNFYKSHRESYHSGAQYNTAPFDGLTGGINVVTHKWNGSTFQTSSARKTYDTYSSNNERWHSDYMGYTCTLFIYYYFPVAARAIVADMNGDGRDEVVVQRMSFNFCDDNTIFADGHEDHSFRHFMVEPCIDVWNFDAGSFQPKPSEKTATLHVTFNGGKGTQTVYAEDGHFKRDMFIKMVSRTDTPYPFFEREFDIIAGKFTGRLGAIITVDDLVVKHPFTPAGNTTKYDGTNYMQSMVSLWKDYDGSDFQKVALNEINHVAGTDKNIPRNYAVGFMTANFLGEGMKLGDPIKVTIPVDNDYLAILQAMPYHVDNISTNGKTLTAEPQNFTLRQDTKVTYTNTSTSADQSNLTYSMTKKAETIFAIDSDALRTTAAGFRGITGIASMVLGSSDIGGKVKKAVEIWDKLSDTVETTTSQSNENAERFTMTITQQANYHDSLYYSQSNRYLWRYPVLTYPAPEWLKGQVKDTLGSFDQSQVKEQQLYITFAMSEPNVPVTGIGLNDAQYHPYHELGNLFSYPADLTQIEGYEGHTYMANNKYQESNPIEWKGSNFNQTLTFTHASTSQDRTVKVNKAGAVTKFLSMIDNVFGSSLANMPQDSDSSFTRTITEKEGISITIPEAYSGARFYTRFEPYIDVAGTMTVGFAVSHFERDDALWGTNSLYSKKPDPSFILPEKFNHTVRADSDWDRAIFTSNDNDPTALKGRGIRYTVSDYNMESDNLLFKGLKYKIRIPVYNASFVNADNVVVRLSHSKTNVYSADRTHIGDCTIQHLPGRDGGNHRQFAEFEWTPDLDDGIYYLFADIDPDNKIDEVHENRHASSRDKTIVDVGGNNMAYFRIGIASSSSPKFDRTKLEVASAGEFLAADSEGYAFPYVHWVKADGLDLEDFIKQKVDGATQPVPAEVEVKYGGEYLMTEAKLIGYKLRPESKGKDVADVTDADIGLVFVNEDFDIFPGEDHKLHFRINPVYLEDGIGFVLQVHGEEYPLTDIIYGSAGGGSAYSSSSSSGCDAGLGLMAGLALVSVLMMKKR